MLSVGQNLCGIIIARRIGEGEHTIRGKDRVCREGCTRAVVGELHRADIGGLRAIQQVKQDRGARDGVIGINRSGVEDRDGGRCIPEERIGGIRVLRQPDLDGLYLARAESRKGDLRRGGKVVGPGRDLDLEFLLIKDRGHEELVRVEIHVVGDGHAAVHHAELLHLEGSRIEGSRGSRGGRAVVEPEGTGGIQLASNLNLLRKGIGRKGNVEAIRARHTPDGNNDVGILVDCKVTRPC